MLFLPASEATIIENWDTLGMRGTGSNDVGFDAVDIPAWRTFVLSDPPARGELRHGQLAKGQWHIGLAAAAVLVGVGRRAAA